MPDGEPPREPRRSSPALVLALALSACLSVPEPDFTAEAPAPAHVVAALPPSAGSGAGDGVAHALALVTWNLEWFLDPTRGPSDDARQLEVARRVLLALGPSVIALQELSSEQALDRLLAGSDLGGHAITSFEWPQQIGVAYTARFSVESVQVLDALASAGRAPLEVVLLDGGSGEQLVVIALHAKAQADPGSWNERHRLALGLHAYLEDRWPETPVVVLGDLNDGLTRSITGGQPSPYAELVADPRYAFPTAALEAASPAAVLLDHVVVSDELAARIAPGAAERVDVTALGGEPPSTVSDHAPIRVQLR